MKSNLSRPSRPIFTRAVIRMAWDVLADPMSYSEMVCEGAAAVLRDLGHRAAADGLLLVAGLPRRAPSSDASVAESALRAVSQPSQLDLFSGAGTAQAACAPGAIPVTEE